MRVGQRAITADTREHEEAVMGEKSRPKRTARRRRGSTRRTENQFREDGIDRPPGGAGQPGRRSPAVRPRKSPACRGKFLSRSSGRGAGCAFHPASGETAAGDGCVRLQNLSRAARDVSRRSRHSWSLRGRDQITRPSTVGRSGMPDKGVTTRKAGTTRSGTNESRAEALEHLRDADLVVIGECDEPLRYRLQTLPGPRFTGLAHCAVPVRDKGRPPVQGTIFPGFRMP